MVRAITATAAVVAAALSLPLMATADSTGGTNGGGLRFLDDARVVPLSAEQMSSTRGAQTIIVTIGGEQSPISPHEILISPHLVARLHEAIDCTSPTLCRLSTDASDASGRVVGQSVDVLTMSPG